MSKEQFFGCKGSKLRKFFAGGLTAVFGSGVCSSCVGSAMQQSVIHKNVQFQENSKNLVNQEQLVLLLFASNKFFLFYMMGNRNQEIVNQYVGNDFEEQQAVEDEFAMSLHLYKKFMEKTNISQDLLSKVRNRGDGTVAMPESLYEKLLSESSKVSLTDGVGKQKSTTKNSYLEKGKEICNSFIESLGIVKETLACSPELLKESPWLLIPIGLAFSYIVLQILIPILLAEKTKLGKEESAEGKLKDEVKVVDDVKIGDKEVDTVDVEGKSAEGDSFAGLETFGKAVVAVGAVDAADKFGEKIANSLSGKGSSESVENEEGPFLFVKNSSSKSSAKADNAKVSKKKKQSAVVPANAV